MMSYVTERTNFTRELLLWFKISPTGWHFYYILTVATLAGTSESCKQYFDTLVFFYVG